MNEMLPSRSEHFATLSWTNSRGARNPTDEVPLRRARPGLVAVGASSRVTTPCVSGRTCDVGLSAGSAGGRREVAVAGALDCGSGWLHEYGDRYPAIDPSSANLINIRYVSSKSSYTVTVKNQGELFW